MDKKKKLRETLIEKAQGIYNEGGNYKPFDPIDYLNYEEGQELMKMEYELGYSDYNPNE